MQMIMTKFKIRHSLYSYCTDSMGCVCVYSDIFACFLFYIAVLATELAAINLVGHECR